MLSPAVLLHVRFILEIHHVLRWSVQIDKSIHYAYSWLRLLFALINISLICFVSMKMTLWMEIRVKVSFSCYYSQYYRWISRSFMGALFSTFVPLCWDSKHILLRLVTRCGFFFFIFDILYWTFRRQNLVEHLIKNLHGWKLLKYFIMYELNLFIFPSLEQKILCMVLLRSTPWLICMFLEFKFTHSTLQKL